MHEHQIVHANHNRIVYPSLRPLLYTLFVLPMPPACDALNEVLLVLVGDILEGALLCLGEQQCRENPCKHEECKDFQDVVDEL